MRRQILIFDLDGVLVNSEGYHSRTCDELVSAVAGKPVDTSFFHFPGVDTTELYRIGLERIGCSGDPAELSRKHFERTFEMIREEIPEPDPEMIRMLESPAVQDRVLYVASSSPRSFVEAVLELYRVRSRFSRVLTGDDVEHLKPAPDIYRLALALSGLEAGQAVAVEDSRIGSMAAVAAGIP